jgi:hypothetical protein
MYGVESTLWNKVASMHLEGPAAHYFQSAERCLLNANWSTFYDQMHDRFGRDQHEALIHQLFHIRQVGSITEYVFHLHRPMLILCITLLALWMALVMILSLL